MTVEDETNVVSRLSHDAIVHDSSDAHWHHVEPYAGDARHLDADGLCLCGSDD